MDFADFATAVALGIPSGVNIFAGHMGAWG
jgi:hypothetical protein